MQVEIREYRPEDFDACLVIFNSNVPRFFTDAERNAFTDFLHALPGPYLVLYNDAGTIIGCGGYAVDESANRCDLCWGMVHQSFHGRGFGKTLILERLSRARTDARIRTIALNTSQHTQGFYERLGFRTIEVIRDGYSPGLDRCEMRLTVESGEAGL